MPDYYKYIKYNINYSLLKLYLLCTKYIKVQSAEIVSNTYCSIFVFVVQAQKFNMYIKKFTYLNKLSKNNCATLT